MPANGRWDLTQCLNEGLKNKLTYNHLTPHGQSLPPTCPLSLSLQWLYSPGWASASFKSFLHPSRFRATILQFLHPSLATSSSTPSSQRSLGLPLGCFPPGSLRKSVYIYIYIFFFILAQQPPSGPRPPHSRGLYEVGLIILAST